MLFNEEEVRKSATQLRKDIINMISKSGSGHPGGSLSAADIMAVLFFGDVMRYSAANPQLPDRDRLILSKGHAAPVLYAALARAGYFQPEELGTLRQLGSRLQGHPDSQKLPGVEVSTGSLGQGLSIACGLALALEAGGNDFAGVDEPGGNDFAGVGEPCGVGFVGNAAGGDEAVGVVGGADAVDAGVLGAAGGTTDVPKKSPLKSFSSNSRRVFVLLGDGECQEGQVWEAVMFAAHKRLKNLIAIVDNNKLQIDGSVSAICNLDNLNTKFSAFGWQVQEIDGHDVNAIKLALEYATNSEFEGPRVIIAHTIKGKGVSFMQGECGWHGKAPSEEQRLAALAELDDGSLISQSLTSGGTL